MKAYGLNALRIASFLTSHPLDALIRTSLSPHPAFFQHPTAVDPCARYTVLRDVSFHVHGGARSAGAFLHIGAELAGSLGGVELLARMTHASILPAERKALGNEGLLRLSCRIGEVNDLRGGLVKLLNASDGANGLH